MPRSTVLSQYPNADRFAVSPAQAATLAGIGRTKLYEAINEGVLPSFKIGTRRLVRVAEIEAWLLRLEEAARPRKADRG